MIGRRARQDDARKILDEAVQALTQARLSGITEVPVGEVLALLTGTEAPPAPLPAPDPLADPLTGCLPAAPVAGHG